MSISLRPTKRLIAVTSFSVLLFVLGFFFLNSRPLLRSRLLGIATPGIVTLQAPATVHLNQTFKLKIIADTQSQAVNAAGIYLRFNPNQLKVLDIDTTESFCQFYPEKRYDNNQGLVSLACGSPHPGVNGINTLLVLELQPITSGPTSIILDPKSKLLLSDGKGTNILQDFTHLSFNILNIL